MSEKRTVLSWQGLFKKHAESGLGVKEFCRRNELTPSNFYYWKKRLSLQMLSKRKNNISSQSFIKIEEKPLSMYDENKITFKISGHEITFSELPDPLWIAQLAKELKNETPAA